VIAGDSSCGKSGTSYSATCPSTPTGRRASGLPGLEALQVLRLWARGDVFEFLRRFEGKDFRTVIRNSQLTVGAWPVNESGSQCACARR